MTQLEFDTTPSVAGLSEVERTVLGLIEERRGEVNAVSAAELCRATKLGDRQLRALVKVLVEQHGCCLCSSPRGFYVPGTPTEVLDCSQRLLSWAFSALKRARALRRTDELHRLCGQLELELSRVQREMEVADADPSA